MQENVGGCIGYDIIDAKFQQPARQQLGLGNVPLVILFFLTHIQDNKLLASLDFRMHLVGC